MSSLIDTFANRLNYAIQIRNVKPIDLVRQTGISKTNISCYMSGKYEAKADGLKLLSKALNIDPIWLMGYDVPMETSSSEDNFKKLYEYMEKNNLSSIKLIPIFDNINLDIDWKNTPTGYTPFDAKIQNCSENNDYFYYKVKENSMDIERDTYILIEDTQDIKINDIILYSIDNKNIELGIYKINLKQEKNFLILGKYVK